MRRRIKEKQLVKKQEQKNKKFYAGSLSASQKKFRDKTKKELNLNRSLLRSIGNWWY